MTSGHTREITRILAELRGGGDQAALSALFALVYDQLRAIAGAQIQHERPGHPLQPTDLVHEAYVRLLGNEALPWTDRAHFFHAAAEAMRRVLIDHARKHARLKRSGGRARLPLNVLDLASAEDSTEILALDEALQRLEKQDGRMGQVVRLRFYAGLSVEDTARTLSLSERTVKREWTLARAWLFRALRADES